VYNFRKRLSWKQIPRKTSRSYMISCQYFSARIDMGVRIILKCISREIGRGVIRWFRLGQDRDQWQAVVNTVINLRIP
jgi:hypothetical protein